MLHANPSNSFFEYSSSAGLDGNACRLIFTRLNDDICARFLGNPVMDNGFQETTATHVLRTYQNLEAHLSMVLPENQQTADTLESLKSKVMIHDISDILRENIVASTEVDPNMKQQMAHNINMYDMVVTPFTYKLALFANKIQQPGTFDEVILSLRDEAITPDQIGRQLDADEVISFTMKSILAVSAEENKLSRYAAWDNANSLEKVNTMLMHYYCIERAIDFSGTQAQIHEKCDGTDYSLSVSRYKQPLGLTPSIYHVPTSLTNRINGRFEKNLNKLERISGYNDQQLLATAATVNYCYGVSEQSFALGKDVVSLHPQQDEPNITDAINLHEKFNQQQIDLLQNNTDPALMSKDHVVALYQEARHELRNNGVLWLPEDGKTLLESKEIIKHTLPEHLHSTLKNLHL